MKQQSSFGFSKLSVMVVTVFALGGAGLVGWGALAPMNGAVLSSGVVAPEGRRQVVQHDDGGIIAKVLVQEGDPVARGQALFHLDQREAHGRLKLMTLEMVQLLSRRMRLEAEILGSETLTLAATDSPRATAASFGPHLVGLEIGQDDLSDLDPAFSRILAVEQAVLRQRQQADLTDASLADSVKASLTSRREGLTADRKAVLTRLSLAREEYRSLAPLYEKGLIRRPRLTQVRDRIALLRGQAAQMKAELAEIEAQKNQVGLEHQARTFVRAEETHKELSQLQAQMLKLAEEMTLARDKMEKRIIRAPTDGLVFNQAINTAGAVIAPRETLMEIVPAAAALIVEAKVRPEDIDAVTPGQDAEVRLTAFNPRHMAPLSGQVTTLSADAVEDKISGERYYLAKVAVASEDLALTPGMTAEVALLTAPRTLFDYLLDPLTKIHSQALREP